MDRQPLHGEFCKAYGVDSGSPPDRTLYRFNAFQSRGWSISENDPTFDLKRVVKIQAMGSLFI